MARRSSQRRLGRVAHTSRPRQRRYGFQGACGTARVHPSSWSGDPDHVEALTNTVTASWLTADGAALGRDSKVGDEVTSRSGEIVPRHEFPTGERIGLR